MELPNKLNFELIWTPDQPTETEGPQWDGDTFRFTRIKDSIIMQYDPASGKVSELIIGTHHANGTMFDRFGNYYACEGGNDRHAIIKYSESGSEIVVDSFLGDRLNMPNDLAFDDHNDLWFTDPWYENVGGEATVTRKDMVLNHESVYRFDMKEKKLFRVVFDTSRPNGLLFDKDYGKLYVAQSGRRLSEEKDLRVYPVFEGTLGPKKILYTFYPNRGIDGMKLDTEERIWATCGDRNNTEDDFSGMPPGPKIAVFDSEGNVLKYYMLPELVQKPTNCAFGGEDGTTLVVTTSKGHVYKAETKIKGLVQFPN